MGNKFLNTDFDHEDIEENENSEYSDKIHISPSKAQEEYFDRNNKITKIFLIVLGSFCVIGVLYYLISWLSSK